MKKTAFLILAFSLASLCANADMVEKTGKGYQFGTKTVWSNMEKLTAAAMANDAKAMYAVGWACANGVGTPKNAELAAQWYKKSVSGLKTLATDNEDIDAMFALGEMYYKGYGVEKYRREGIDWYKKAAGKGNIDAMVCVGDCYLAISRSQALDWFRKAADAGNAQAMCRMGDTLKATASIDEAPKVVAAWYAKAASAGSGEGMGKLGECYEMGFGVEKNLAKAKKLYKDAEAHGRPKASIILKEMH